jgi:FkbM family methyltransferase
MKSIIPKKYNLLIRWYKHILLVGKDKELEYISSKLSGNTAIDIGSNIGFYSYVMSKKYKNVMSFEPIANVSQFLKDAEIENIQIYNYALSNKDEKSKIYLPKLYGSYQHAYAGLDLNKRNDDYISLDIKTKPLDSFKFENVDLIKIDVEGHEISVLEGARKTIYENSPIMILELEERHKKGIIDECCKILLDEFGYSGFYFDDNEINNITNFDIEKNQQLNENGDPLDSKKYINNFIFTKID